MGLINLIKGKDAEKVIAQIDSDIIPDLKQALLDAVDKLIKEVDGLTITVTVNRPINTGLYNKNGPVSGPDGFSG